MTARDLRILKELLARTNNLPDILHLRAADYDYTLTDDDKKLLLNTYQKLDDILKEVAAFINVKFSGRKDHIHAWNKIDFDTKIGGFKVVTTDNELIRSSWNMGMFDLKSLIKSLINEVALMVENEDEVKESLLVEEKEEWDKYFDKLLEKRADHADYFLDMIVEKGLINLDKLAVRKYFKKWFSDSQNFDLQFKNGDFAIEDNDIQIVPDFNKENIPEFLKWFENKGNDFIDYLKAQGVNVKKDSKEIIINSGNLIINKHSKTGKQILKKEAKEKESNWSKVNVIIAIIVGIATVAGVIWQILN